GVSTRPALLARDMAVVATFTRTSGVGSRRAQRGRAGLERYRASARPWAHVAGGLRVDEATRACPRARERARKDRERSRAASPYGPRERRLVRDRTWVLSTLARGDRGGARALSDVRAR